MPTHPQTSRRALTDGPPAAWSTRDLAAWTGMSLDFFLDEIDAGELRAVRFGRSWRVPVSEVTRYLANKGFPVPPIASF
jgi:excisionase family DNA binding protein